MRLFHVLSAALALGGLCPLQAWAESNPLSVHVLNLQNGLPSAAMSVSLEKQEGERWAMLNSGESRRFILQTDAWSPVSIGLPSKPERGLNSKTSRRFFQKCLYCFRWMVPFHTTIFHCC